MSLTCKLAFYVLLYLSPGYFAVAGAGRRSAVGDSRSMWSLLNFFLFNGLNPEYARTRWIGVFFILEFCFTFLDIGLQW